MRSELSGFDASFSSSSLSSSSTRDSLHRHERHCKRVHGELDLLVWWKRCHGCGGVHRGQFQRERAHVFDHFLFGNEHLLIRTRTSGSPWKRIDIRELGNYFSSRPLTAALRFRDAALAQSVEPSIERLSGGIHDDDDDDEAAENGEGCIT